MGYVGGDGGVRLKIALGINFVYGRGMCGTSFRGGAVLALLVWLCI